MKSLKSLRFHNFNIETMSQSKLPPTLESLAFVDNRVDPMSSNPYGEEHVLEQFIQTQQHSSCTEGLDTRGLREFRHIQ